MVPAEEVVDEAGPPVVLACGVVALADRLRVALVDLLVVAALDELVPVVVGPAELVPVAVELLLAWDAPPQAAISRNTGRQLSAVRRHLTVRA